MNKWIKLLGFRRLLLNDLLVRAVKQSFKEFLPIYFLDYFSYALVEQKIHSFIPFYLISEKTFFAIIYHISQLSIQYVQKSEKTVSPC